MLKRPIISVSGAVGIGDRFDSASYDCKRVCPLHYIVIINASANDIIINSLYKRTSPLLRTSSSSYEHNQYAILL